MLIHTSVVMECVVKLNTDGNAVAKSKNAICGLAFGEEVVLDYDNDRIDSVMDLAV